MLLNDVLKRIRSHKEAYYFIVDETLFFTDEIVTDLKKTISNSSFVYPDSLNVENLLEDLNTLSLFSSKRVIIFKQSESLSKKQIDSLIRFLSENEVQAQNVRSLDYHLVFVASQKTSHDLFKFCKKQGVLFEFKKPYASQMPFWIEWMVRKENKSIEPMAARLLQEKVGVDLMRLKMEIEKLSLYCGGRVSIEEADVKTLLYDARSHSVFELMDAIGEKKGDRALTIAERMIDEGESELFICAMIFRFLKNLWLANEWKGELSDTDVQRKLGIHPFFWEKFKRQRDYFSKAPFKKYWSEALKLDTFLKTNHLCKEGILVHYIWRVCAN